MQLDIIFITYVIFDALAVFGLTTLVVQGIIRTWKTYKNEQYITWIRVFLTLTFFFRLIDMFLILHYERFNLGNNPLLYTSNTNEIALNTIMEAAMIINGSFIVTYAFKLDNFFLLPPTFYFSAILHFILTGNSFFHTFFIYIGGSISLMGLFYVSFKVKDDRTMGVALIFTLMFVTAFFSEANIELVFDSIGVILIGLLIFNKFKVFKLKEEKD